MVNLNGMKKFFKKLMWALAGIMALIFVFMITYLLISKSAMKKMMPVETRKVTDDVFAVRNKYVNMYLVKDGDHFIAIDAGIRRGAVKDELKKLDIDPDKVRAVLLTHSDGDHAGGISLFDKAVIYLPEDEEQVINGETGRFLWFGNKIDTENYKLLKDKSFRIGDLKIRMIPTPGHTAGSTCYIVNDKYLFTGDALALHNGNIERFPKIINKSTRKARKSMDNITGLDDVQYIFTAHYGYTDNYKAATSSKK
jgi:glyoxylase-like metal-dependent hydrolase (beta-lactamase superfamily II)